MKHLITVLLCVACCGNAAFAQSLWEMPACSWTRSFGDRPIYQSFPHKDPDGALPETVTKKGIPLGGIGAGSLMYNFCGSFGPFYMKPGAYQERFLTQAAFHVREEVKGKATSFTLATEDVLPAWKRLNKGDAIYKALFPKATFDFMPFQTRISLLQFSPVIKDNYRETSYPVGLFVFKAKNESKETVTLSFMFTFPNTEHLMPPDDGKKNNLLPQRSGLYNKVLKDKSQTAILLGASDTSNVAETQNSAWCIATSAKATYIETWDGNGDGADVWNDFTDDGSLRSAELVPSQRDFQPASSRSAGFQPASQNAGYKPALQPAAALCVKIRLKPGAEATIPFALSWYFPLTTFGDGDIWKKRYTEYFPENQDVTAAARITGEALQKWRDWLALVDAWTLPIANNPNCPDWLKAGALNELYYQTFGGSFWENGMVNGIKKYGNREGQHIAGVMECMEYNFIETFDVRHHSTSVTRDLWPNIEKDIILTYNDIIAATAVGACTHDLGSPRKSPVNKPDDYVRWYRPGQETTPWSEFSPKFIQQVYMYWKQYGDNAFLDSCWNSVIRSFNYQVATDKDNNGITDMRSSEYIDNELLNAVLWITSLEALKEMAVFRGDKEIETLAGFQLSKARTNSEKLYWNDELGFYKYNETVPFLMADAMVGQRCGDVFGLPSALDPKRMHSHYNQCFERLVKPLRDYDGDGVGDLGAANILNLEGKPGVKTSEHAHEQEVWTGVAYNLAASMYHSAVLSNDAALKQKALLTGKGVYFQCWLNNENGFWFGSPEALWFNEMPKARGLMYQRARGIWELMMEVSKDN